MPQKRTTSALTIALLSGVALATAVAPSAQAAETPTAAQGTWIMSTTGSDLITVNSPKIGDPPNATKRASVAEALASGSTWGFPRLGSWGAVRAAGTNSCLTAERVDTFMLAQSCDGTDGQQFSWARVDNGTVSGYTLVAKSLPNAYLHRVGTTLEMTNSPKSALVTRVENLSGLGLLTANVTFGSTVTETATIAGTGAVGASVTVTADGVTLGRASVVNGSWSLPIPATVGPGRHAFTVAQTLGAISTTTTVEKDFGAAVTGTGPTTSFSGDSTTITGMGTNGAAITVSEGSSIVGTTVVAGGTWSVPARGLAVGDHTFTVSQTAPGDITTTDTITATRTTTRVNLTQTNLRDGSTFTIGRNTFTGTGTPGGTVALEPTNFPAAPVSTVVGPDGTWSIMRALGDGPYTMKLTQTAQGITDTIDDIHLRPVGTGVKKDFTTTTRSGDTFRPGTVTFYGTGDGSGASTVTLEITYPAGLTWVTVPVDKDGNWTMKRAMGDGPYTISFVQTKGDGTTTRIDGINLTPRH